MKEVTAQEWARLGDEVRAACETSRRLGREREQARAYRMELQIIMDHRFNLSRQPEPRRAGR